MFVVDTNILVYAADRDAEAHTACRERLEHWRHQAAPWYLTWNICYEFLRVSTHPRVFPNPWRSSEARQFIDALLVAPGLGMLSASPRHADVLRQTLDELPDIKGNLMHELQTATLMREHGISQIVTRDTDFHRFPFITVIDPLR